MIGTKYAEMFEMRLAPPAKIAKAATAMIAPATAAKTPSELSTPKDAPTASTMEFDCTELNTMP